MVSSQSQRPSLRRELRQVALILGVLLVLELVAWLPKASAASLVSGDPVASPRVFDGNGDGVRDRTVLTFRLQSRAPVTVRILDYRKAVVRTLIGGTTLAAGTHTISWNGRLASGTVAPDGGYRFRLTVGSGSSAATFDCKMTKSPNLIFAANPGAMTVALDAGHGGPDPGAVRDGYTEASANLDIALRTRAMLEGAGITVVGTRSTNTRVNTSNTDFNHDGKVDKADELASRIDLANRARAAAFLCIHNNSGSSTTARGTETFYWQYRTFAVESKQLATLVQSSVVRRLNTAGSFRTVDRGTKSYDFYVLNGYDAARRVNPSLMPGVLSEGLFVSNTTDRTMLKTARGRARLAEGYYDGLARYFANRTYGAAYRLDAPPSALLAEGSSTSLSVTVTNTSARTWTAGSVALTLSALPRVEDYDGTNAAGARLATIDLPALAVGRSVAVDVPFVVPDDAGFVATAGRALLKVDLIAGGQRYASHGVVPLPIPVTISGDSLTPPDPTPTPTPTEAPTPTPTPTPAPTPTPTAPDLPTPSPSSETSPAPSADGATVDATQPPPPTPSPTPTPTSTADPTLDPVVSEAPSASP
jgi:N-acetylmuramoyl-L-alanine amidase